MHPSYHVVGSLLYVFGCRISSFVGPNLFIDGCSAVSCDFGVLVGEGELKVLLLCYLVPPPRFYKIHINSYKTIKEFE